MTDNPLKSLSTEELIRFSDKLDSFTTKLNNLYDSHTDSSGGIFDPYGLGLLRALYVCVLKMYVDHGLMTLKEIAAPKTGFSLDLADNVTDMASFSAGVFDPQEFEYMMEEMTEYSDWFSDQVFGEIPFAGDIYDLSKLDGIGDFIETELPAEDAYELYFGTDDEEEENEVVDAELPDFFREHFQDIKDAYENYFSQVVSCSICRSKKLGKAVELLQKKGYDEKKIKKVPLLNTFVCAIEIIYEKNLWFLDSYNGDLVENGEWFGYTLTSGCCDDPKAITIFQRIPCVRGYAYLVQEIADRILDGRFQC